jgi:hypothetical protein
MRTIKKIGDSQVGNLSDLEASIMAAIANAGGTIEIEFCIPKATSPKALGQSSGQRVFASGKSIRESRKSAQ